MRFPFGGVELPGCTVRTNRLRMRDTGIRSDFPYGCAQQFLPLSCRAGRSSAKSDLKEIEKTEPTLPMEAEPSLH